jgi:chromosome segregation ATPase
MDGSATMSEIRENFRTPLRILLPKLLKSRNDWKAKSDGRKAQLKAAKIKIRDCSASRDRWRQRTEQLQEENRQLQERLERSECALEQSRAALTQLENAKKK